MSNKKIAMKRLLIITLIVPVVAFTCKQKAAGPTDWLEGKVVRTSCASFIIQVMNNDAIGTDGWKDMSNNNVSYNNVFNANNKCEIPNSIKAGDTVKFKITAATKSDCIVCMMYDGPPEAKYDVKEISVVDGK
jgi:hypothetical protein